METVVSIGPNDSKQFREKFGQLASSKSAEVRFFSTAPHLWYDRAILAASKRATRVLPACSLLADIPVMGAGNRLQDAIYFSLGL
jgi:hypothetical protein